MFQGDYKLYPLFVTSLCYSAHYSYAQNILRSTLSHVHFVIYLGEKLLRQDIFSPHTALGTKTFLISESLDFGMFMQTSQVEEHPWSKIQMLHNRSLFECQYDTQKVLSFGALPMKGTQPVLTKEIQFIAVSRR